MRRRRKRIDAIVSRIVDAPEARLADLLTLERKTTGARAPGGWPRAQIDRVFEVLSRLAKGRQHGVEERCSAIYALRGLDEGRSADIMLAVLADTSAPSKVRADALDGLGYLGPDVVARSRRGVAYAAELLASATTDPSPDIRFWAIYAIGALELRALRAAVAARAGDRESTSEGHAIATEASDVLVVLDGGRWPEA